jgi:hypothetical protein
VNGPLGHEFEPAVLDPERTFEYGLQTIRE